MKYKIFVGFDLETGDEFSKEGHDKTITELGAVKYLYMDGKFTPIGFLSLLVNEGKGVSEEAEEYTGITTGLIEMCGVELRTAMNKFGNFISNADFIVSHNGDAFDIPVIKAAMERSQVIFDIPTNVDTMTCVPYPNNCKSRNLTYLQAFHGFANPFPHRAATDVLSMFKVMENYDVDQIIRVAQSPNVKYTAQFQYPNERRCISAGLDFQDEMKKFNEIKDKVKSLGFRWEPSGKVWIYEGKQVIFEETIRPNLPCNVRQI